MVQLELPVPRAYFRLLDVARGSMHFSSARLYALTWLAAARMFALGAVPGLKSLNDLTIEEGWRALEDAGLPGEAVAHGFSSSGVLGQGEMAQRVAAVGIVTELHEELGRQVWDVLPCLGSVVQRPSYEPDGGILPVLGELLLDLVGPPDTGTLWIPFDLSGQFTLGAFRRGWSVLTASPLGVPSTLLEVLLTIETGTPSHPRIRTGDERDAAGRPLTRADYILALPPFGMPMRGSRLVQWDSTGGRGIEQFARSETWAVQELVNRASRRVVIVVPPGVLFTKGQEQRLREAVLQRGGERNELEAVIALPSGVFSSTSLAGAVLVINPGGHADHIRMVDLGGGKRSGVDAEDILLGGRDIALGIQRSSERSTEVAREEVLVNECSFAPSRYLRRFARSDANVVSLGDLCAAIRPPSPSKDMTGALVAEVGIPELGPWRALSGPFAKTVSVRKKGDEVAGLLPGDLVISIKGTVGKVGLVGALPKDRATVVSQSCIALRPKPEQRANGLVAEYLLMYLRSQEGQAQLASLQVGAGVQHVSPSTLLSSMVVPVPAPAQQHAVAEDYRHLCDIEQRISELSDEMATIARQRWTIELDEEGN
ncbi:N-6 DNA methylase [Paraburkholderia sp. BR10937]|uniref:N-6 DNA methylase n=1 Tax=Paraburkholderia sp. BR10937 TaxID=3236994 RepID=UPI0034D34BB5